MKNALSWGLAVALGLAPLPASAALTDSEKAVVRTFVEKAVLDTAPRVRSLVARPDLTPDEIAEPLRGGYTAAPFDEKHQRFTEGLLFGPGSDASRTALVPPVVAALLARAATRMPEVTLEFGRRISAKERAAVDELLRIHAFVDHAIANAGKPPAVGHDATQAIRDEALRACVEQYRVHLTAHERWMNGEGRAPAELVRVRAQIALALVDLASGVVPRREVGAALGLKGAIAGLFDRTGVLVVTDGPSPDARVAEAARFLETQPAATDGLALWLLGKTSPAGLASRGRVVRAGVSLGEPKKPVVADALFGPDVKPSRPDRTTAAVALSVGELIAARALARSELLQERARQAAQRAGRAGPAGFLAADAASRVLAPEAGVAPPPSAVETLSSAIRLLLLDAPRAVDLALIRAGNGRPEPLEQLAFAMGLLAGDRPSVTLGKTLDDGRVEPLKVDAVKTDADLVTAFQLDGHRYAIAADANSVFQATVDGKPAKLTALASFQEHATLGSSFRGAGADFEKLSGDPRGAGLDDGRFLLEGGSGGIDAVASGPELADLEVWAKVRPIAAGGGLLVRGAAGESSYVGVAVVLEREPAQARLLAYDGRNKAFQLVEPVAIGAEPKDGYPVVLRVVGGTVTAFVGGKTLESALPEWIPAMGRGGVSVAASGRVEIRDFKAIAAKAPKPPAKPPAKKGK